MLLLLFLVAPLQPQPAQARRVAIAPLASVVLPHGVSAVITQAYSDAWCGFIEPADKAYHLDYGVGLVEKTIAPEARPSFLWRKEEGALEYGVVLVDNQLLLMAQVGWTGFVSTIPDEAHLDPLLAIVRSLDGPCARCEKAQRKNPPARKRGIEPDGAGLSSCPACFRRRRSTPAWADLSMRKDA